MEGEEDLQPSFLWSIEEENKMECVLVARRVTDDGGSEEARLVGGGRRRESWCGFRLNGFYMVKHIWWSSVTA